MYHVTHLKKTRQVFVTSSYLLLSKCDLMILSKFHNSSGRLMQHALILLFPSGSDSVDSIKVVVVAVMLSQYLASLVK